jgi:deoxyribonuclease-4
VVPAKGAGGVLGERVAVALPVRGAQEGRDDLEAPVVDPAGLAPEVGEPEVDIQLEKLDSRRSLRHAEDRTLEIGRSMATIRFGPARLPSRESPEAAVELLLERGHSACEIDFEGGFWMKDEWRFATRLGELAAEAGIALSVHAPIAAFLGHLERDQKYRRAVGMLDHTAGVAVACGAELVVFHPGFLLGRERPAALDALVEQLAELRERLEAKERAVPFGIEIMGRVRELGTAEDVFAVCARLGWVRPVLDFAHLHAVTDGAFVDEAAFAGVLGLADAILEPGAPFHVHFSDIAFANRNETKHLPYGEGTLRAEPLAAALASFERPATVISESPDERSHQEIRAALLGSRV